MAQIKSALELALEKTRDLKADPAVIEAGELKQEGKRCAGRYLEDPSTMDLASKIESHPKEKRLSLKAGMHEIFSAQLQLPNNDAAMEKLAMIASGYAALVGGSGLVAGAMGAVAEKRIQALFQQLEAFLRRYLDDMKNVDQVIRKQWAPKLREKERAMAARMGQDVRLDPMADPEFAAFYKQNVGAVRDQYQAALDKAKLDIAGIIGLVAEG
jgi:hypothetical protein